MGIVIGLVVGLIMGIGFSVALNLPSLFSASTGTGYTSVKVLSGSVEHVAVGGEDFTITYKWWGADNIQIQVDGSNIDRPLDPIQDRTYDIAGIEVIVSEVYEEYVILLLK